MLEFLKMTAGFDRQPECLLAFRSHILFFPAARPPAIGTHAIHGVQEHSQTYAMPARHGKERRGFHLHRSAALVDSSLDPARRLAKKTVGGPGLARPIRKTAPLQEPAQDRHWARGRI